MKKNRYIPYGYTMKNGKLVIDNAEAEIIRAIFNRYIAGASLGEIASELTIRQVPYTEKNTDWDKARIARIIENSKYIGDKAYDAIVDGEVYNEAISCKRARKTYETADLGEDIKIIRDRVQCRACGAPMVRKSEKRNRIKQSWICFNAECGCKIHIKDEDLTARITTAMNKIIANPELLTPTLSDERRPIEVTRMINEMNRELDRAEPNDDFILSQIFGIAAEQYKVSDAQNSLNAQRIKNKLHNVIEQESFVPDIFKMLVSHITLGEDTALVLHTKTNTIIQG